MCPARLGSPWAIWSRDTGIPSGTTVSQNRLRRLAGDLEPECNGKRGRKPGVHADHRTAAGRGTYRSGWRRCYTSILVGLGTRSPFSRDHRDSTPAECMTTLPLEGPERESVAGAWFELLWSGAWRRWPMAASSNSRWTSPIRTRRLSLIRKRQGVSIALQPSTAGLAYKRRRYADYCRRHARTVVGAGLVGARRSWAVASRGLRKSRQADRVKNDDLFRAQLKS